MPFASKYEGKCKDCGKVIAIGTQIERNNAEHYCPDGKNCQGTMQVQGTQTFQTSQVPPNPSSIAFAKECLETFIAICANNNIDPATQQLHTVFNTGVMQKGGRI
jgi:hypothetical protein